MEKHTKKILHRCAYFAAAVLVLIYISVIGCERAPGKKEVVEKSSELQTAVEDLRMAPPYTAVMAFGDVQVTKQELRDAFMDLFRKPKETVGATQAVQNTLEYVASRNYLYLEGLQRGVQVDPEMKLEWDVKSALWLGDYFAREELSRIDVGEEVLEALIPDNAFVFNLHQVSVKELAAAQDLRERVLAGENFSDLANEYSIDPSAPNGGKIKKPQVMTLDSIYGDEVLSRLVDLKEGEISPILETPMGYTFFRIDGKRPLDQKERTKTKKRYADELRYKAEQGMLETFVQKYPLNVNEEALKEALITGDEETVVARVGSFEVTYRFLKGFAGIIKAENRPSGREVVGWLKLFPLIHGPLAAREEAVAQGLEKSEIVKDNYTRVRKYALVNTFKDILLDEVEPGVEEVYLWYRKEMGVASTEGIFSIDGVKGLSEGGAQSVSTRLKEGKLLGSALKMLAHGEKYERVSGTFSDSDLERTVLLALERAPAGNAVGPVREGKSWSVYSLTAKSRGEMVPFDQVYDTVRESLLNSKYSSATKEIIFRQNQANMVKYYIEKPVIGEVITQWLNFQKALVGISPPGGYHSGGMSPAGRKKPGQGHP